MHLSETSVGMATWQHIAHRRNLIEREPFVPAHWHQKELGAMRSFGALSSPFLHFLHFLQIFSEAGPISLISESHAPL